MAKILVMIPSGEVYNHDCVRWYEYQQVQKHIDHYHNIGDAFVFDSSLKLLNYDKLDVLAIRNVKPGDVERYNAEYDYVFLRGSNYIHSHMDWENAEQVLPKLKIPILAFGVGAQAPVEGKLQLSEQSKRIWKIIADKSASLGVRGTYTAEVLWDLGIKNVRIVGCPTAFRNNDPDLRIDLPPLDEVKKVGTKSTSKPSPAKKGAAGKSASASTVSNGGGSSSNPVTGGTTCQASTYGAGDGTAGGPTASGETFDPSKLTAASRTLPLGSTIRVTNVSNGKTVSVRINDRGPYVGGRCLDLSTAAMNAIAPGAGLVTVRYQ